jgi:hypothetical protein
LKGVQTTNYVPFHRTTQSVEFKQLYGQIIWIRNERREGKMSPVIETDYYQRVNVPDALLIVTYTQGETKALLVKQKRAFRETRF